MSVTLFLAAAAATAQPTAVPVNSESVEQIEVAYDALAEGRNQAAIEQMRNSDLVKAGDPAALINLGTAYARLGMIEEARESFDAAAASEDRYMLELADGSWVDSRRAARTARRNLTSEGAFASR